MTSSRRRWWCVSAVLSVVCLALLALNIFPELLELESAPDPARARPESAGAPFQELVLATSASGASTTAPPAEAQKPTRRSAPAIEMPRQGTEGRRPTPQTQSVASDQPPREIGRQNPSHQLVLKPLGYVEKERGKVEAIVDLGGGIEIVHEGEVVAERYRVASVSADTVNLLDLRAVEAPLVAGLTGPKPPPRSSGRYDGGTQGQWIGLPSQQPPPPAALGIVIYADGRVETVMADGDNVRLVQGEPVMQARLAPPSAPPLAFGETQPLAQEPEESLEQADAEQAYDPENPILQSSHEGEPPADPGEAGDGLLGGDSGAAAYALPNTYRPTPSLPTGRATLQGPPLTQDPLTDGNPGAPRPIGYVEFSEGERRAVIEAFDQVYLVREGEVFAGRYRALRVAADGTEIVEVLQDEAIPPPPEESEGIPPPGTAGIRPGEEYLQAPRGGIFTRAGPRVREGPVREFTSGGERPSRAVLSLFPRGGVEGGHGPPPRSAGLDSLNQALEMLGYVETTPGNVRAIVADSYQVYLVRTGEVFAERFRVVSVARTHVEVEPAPGGASSVPTLAHASPAGPVDSFQAGEGEAGVGVILGPTAGDSRPALSPDGLIELPSRAIPPEKSGYPP